jgi:hypothetical protein
VRRAVRRWRAWRNRHLPELMMLYVNTGVLSVDEARARLNLPPWPDGAVGIRR